MNVNYYCNNAIKGDENGWASDKLGAEKKCAGPLM